MSTATITTKEQIELPAMRSTSDRSLNRSRSDDIPNDAAYSTTAIPDGGYGWTIVLCCGIVIFWNTTLISCWGVLQTALLSSKLQHVEPSTLSFVGSMCLAGGAFFSIPANRMMRSVGSRITSILGVLFLCLSAIGSGFCTGNISALFGTIGVLGGAGCALTYAVSNAMPVQYFSGKLGLANGLVKMMGGIGGCVMAVSLEALNRRVGIEWTFIVQGLLTIGTGLPAAWFLKERIPLRNTPSVDLDMFQSLPFVAFFLATAIGTFALFVPSYYLPLFAQSLGLSSSTGAGIVAGYNACVAVGRFIAGPLCDRFGPVNVILITMLLNAVSMLAIWPLSNSLGPLIVFATINGLSNGGFFTEMPTVAAGMFGPGRAIVAMSMTVSGASLGYLMGAPIAGYLLQAAGGKLGDGASQGIAVYRPAIFYAGAVAVASSLFLLAARVQLTKKILKKV